LEEQEIFYGWYSEQQAQCSDTICIYRKENGAEVITSLVSSTPDHGSLWTDIKFVGRITDCVRIIENPHPKTKESLTLLTK